MDKIQDKIAEAIKRGFTVGNQHWGVHYPTMGLLQIEDVKYNKMHNSLTANSVAKGLGGIELNSTIYEFNTDKWATTAAPQPVEVKIKPIVNPLSIRRGDFVKFTVGDVQMSGNIIKYPSNTAIVIETNDLQTYTVDKLQILHVISKAK